MTSSLTHPIEATALRWDGRMNRHCTKWKTFQKKLFRMTSFVRSKDSKDINHLLFNEGIDVELSLSLGEGFAPRPQSRRAA